MISVIPTYDQWTPVTEELPPLHTDVFVQSTTVNSVTHETIGRFDGSRWTCPMIPNMTVAAWSPLPPHESEDGNADA